MGRPIVSTNSIGCRETVDDGVNGYLCIPGDSNDLSKKMEQILQLDDTKRKAMGKNGREKMELEFDEQIVIQKYLEAIKECQ
jgi:glycosyltransferase involved in cell wall biosynthesis